MIFSSEYQSNSSKPNKPLPVEDFGLKIKDRMVPGESRVDLSGLTAIFTRDEIENYSSKLPELSGPTTTGGVFCGGISDWLEAQGGPDTVDAIVNGGCTIGIG